MEASTLTLWGENADRFAERFIETKAREVRRSLNKRGVRDITRYQGDGFTKVSYERGSAYENSWLVVTLLVEQIDDETCTVVLFVGGGGEGPFKLEAISLRRLLKGEQSVGQTGRFATVLRDVKQVCETLDLTADTEWQSETDTSLLATLERKIFDE